MSLLQITLVLVTLINLVYVLIAAHLLNQVLKNTETAKHELLRAAHHSIEASQALGTAARRSITEMERIYRTHYESDKSLAREVHELGSQIQLLATPAASPPHGQAHSATDDAERSLDDGRAKLRADLNTALSHNHQLQHELDLTRNRLSTAIGTNRELQTEMQDHKVYNRSLVDGLHHRLKEMEEDLLQAQARARKAEKHAEDNAVLLDEVRLQLHAQWQHANTPHTDVPDTPDAASLDQSGLIDSQQQQIDTLAERERMLMSRIAQLEDTIARNQAEKTFIEDRFLQIDAQLDATPPKAG
ncbi:MAG: hypothetical protein ACT4NV_00120 [Rhodoferax sp.]